MAGGKATNQTITLPPVFGPTTLWFDDGTDADADLRDRRVADAVVPRPVHRGHPDARRRDGARRADDVAAREQADRRSTRRATARAAGWSSPRVRAGLHGRRRAVRDADGAPPCTAGDYDHVDGVLVLARRAIRRRPTRSGRPGDRRLRRRRPRVQRPDRDRLPADVRRRRRPTSTRRASRRRSMLDAELVRPTGSRTRSTSSATRRRRSRSTTRRSATLDADYTTYKQWKIDPAGAGGDCTGNERDQRDHRRASSPTRSRDARRQDAAEASSASCAPSTSAPSTSGSSIRAATRI